MVVNKKKVFVLGLDSIPPELLFDRWLDQLPNLKRLISNSVYGEMESTIPAITCPAWMSMMTSVNPGRLGIYGFRNRSSYDYDGLSFVNSRAVKFNTVWDVLSKIGKKAVVIGVPMTYPPQPLNGCMVTCFMTPDTKSEYTYPPELKNEVEAVTNGYMLDVDEFRSDNKDNILKAIYEMTEKRFRLTRHFMRSKEWDFFMMVEMGPDRIHHAFWKYFDENHPKYTPGSKYQNAILDYYKYLDKEIGETIGLLSEDTMIIIVSDHGAKKMVGGICINEWLIQNGYMKLVQYPSESTPFNKLVVDWENTKVWGEGGYYGRIFMNVKGREPKGVIAQSHYEHFRNELIKKLEDLRDENGKSINTKVFKPEDIYSECNGIPPDLIVYYGNLDWRSIGSVGTKTIWASENDTGPDDANHSQYGIFIMQDSRKQPGMQRKGVTIYDIAPTILNYMGVKAPDDMEGKII
ncbi:MAG: phosphodiesterase [Planctomycetes bacterium RIFCSPLOWO2_12_FULL_39_13]|nr:MAG: phosphodiesterase [Planctomycetes bacterium GWA2_39_15]OHB41094.1 MAG: phosphodiesterase [Planctomycetes bacterium GWC2_39_26]OHB99720.1 MAG: phosphodiesterase [Planctomycetes bacterium RIFCSPLOWO2_12_FULL_39_13]